MSWRGELDLQIQERNTRAKQQWMAFDQRTRFNQVNLLAKRLWDVTRQLETLEISHQQLETKHQLLLADFERKQEYSV